MGLNFKECNGFKNFSTGRVAVYLGSQYLTTWYELLQNLSLTKIVLLAWNFLFLMNLACYYMPKTFKKIIFLQKLYYFFEVLFLLRILLRALNMVALEEPSLGLSFYKNFLVDLKIPFSVTRILYICLIFRI